MTEILPIALPLLLIIIAAGGSAHFEQKIPIGSRFYRFHVIFYPVVAMLGLVIASLMKPFPAFDWWVDDAIIFLQLIFAILGSVLCVGLAPVVWGAERRSDLRILSKIAKVIIFMSTTMPYFIIVGLLVFYRE